MNRSQKYITELETIHDKWCKDLDNEIAHLRADDILCKLLRELGYGDVVSAFEKIEKWYA